MKLPNAKTVIKDSGYGNPNEGSLIFHQWEVERLMIDFARQHRKSILKTASSNAKFNHKMLNCEDCEVDLYNDFTTLDEDDYPLVRFTINKESILECYPENKIK